MHRIDIISLLVSAALLWPAGLNARDNGPHRAHGDGVSLSFGMTHRDLSFDGVVGMGPGAVVGVGYTLDGIAVEAELGYSALSPCPKDCYEVGGSLGYAFRAGAFTFTPGLHIGFLFHELFRGTASGVGLKVDLRLSEQMALFADYRYQLNPTSLAEGKLSENRGLIGSGGLRWWF